MLMFAFTCSVKVIDCDKSVCDVWSQKSLIKRFLELARTVLVIIVHGKVMSVFFLPDIHFPILLPH